ncbi:CST complex subunit CTC1 [Pelodytes ibericus]
METEDSPGAQVVAWLESAQHHARDFLQNGAESLSADLGDAVVSHLRGICPGLPLSYSFTPISQLISLQHSPCVSLLGWGTDIFQTWSVEGMKNVQDPPSATDKILPRARLLLLGYISDQSPESPSQHDGNLYLRDSSGCIPCEMLHLDLSLLGALVLLPCWSYISPGPGASTGGYLEVLAPPLPILPPPPPLSVDFSDPAAGSPLTPTDASLLLNDRSSSRKSRVAVIGELLAITSLVNIRRKSFFFFVLKDSENSVPMIVQVPSKLSWYHALCVGKTYEVTSLSVSHLRGSSRRVFALTSSSRLLCCPPQPVSLPVASTVQQAERRDVIQEKNHPRKQRVRRDHEKMAKTLSYNGVLTRVLDARAGLYELDRKVTLCTSYLQLLNGGRGLRVGARVEVSDAHLQQSPSSLFSTLVLSCCLRSSLRVLEFSRLCSPPSPIAVSNNLHLHLLFRYRLSLPEYLWVSHVVDQLRKKLSPRFVTQRCLSGSLGSGPLGMAENLLSQTLSSFSKPGERNERDLEEEILAETHDCPLQSYSPLTPPWSLPLLAKMPPIVSDSRYLKYEESTHRLHWSCHIMQAEDLPDRPVLVGVLQISPSGSIQLQDRSHSLPCLILPCPPIAWIDCVLEVRHYRLVTEYILNKEKTERRHNKTYVLFLTQDVKVLHPPLSCPTCLPSVSSSSPASKKSRVGGSWASRLVLVEGLEGRTSRPDCDGQLQFKARAIWMEPPRLHNGRPDEGEEGETDKGHKIVLMFSDSSVRWYHFLQPNCVYRMIANGETDLEIFDRLARYSLKVTHSPPCLDVPSDWTLQAVKTPTSFPSPLEVVSIEQVLKMSSTASLLSVRGVLSHRSMCDTQDTRLYTPRPPVPESTFPFDVSLKVTLSECISHTSVTAYLDMSRGPYPLGLLPGATVLLQGLERKVSRTGSVYLRSVHTSCVRVLSTPTESSQQIAPPPFMSFIQLPGLPAPRRAMCSVSCVLGMTLHWDCSQCGDVFHKGTCHRSPTCSSQTGVFRAKASVIAEDGTGEVLVHLQDDAVELMLGVSHDLWEVLKTWVLSKGKVMVKTRGRNYEIMSEEQNEDALQCYLTFLMSRPTISRPLILTFKPRGSATGSLPTGLTRFTRGERDYITRVPAPPTVICLCLEEAEPRALCHMIRERNQADIT